MEEKEDFLKGEPNGDSKVNAEQLEQSAQTPRIPSQTASSAPGYPGPSQCPLTPALPSERLPELVSQSSLSPDH